jgi:hypothetical protein
LPDPQGPEGMLPKDVLPADFSFRAAGKIEEKTSFF